MRENGGLRRRKKVNWKGKASFFQHKHKVKYMEDSSFFQAVKHWLKIKLQVPNRCEQCELLGLCRTEPGYQCSSKGCLLLWQEEHPSPNAQPLTRKTVLAKDKSREISLKELEEFVLKKHQKQL